MSKAFSMNLLLLLLLIATGNILLLPLEPNVCDLKLWEWSSPEAGLDLTAAVDVALVLHGQGQVPQVIQANAGII